MVAQYLKPIGLGSSLEGWQINPTWDHWGDPTGPGDLLLHLEHRHGTEDQRQELFALVKGCERHYATRAAALLSLEEAVKAWESAGRSNNA
jgi:hypothetical protein